MDGAVLSRHGGGMSRTAALFVEGDFLPEPGDLPLRTHFVGYQLEKGVQVPAGYNTVSDFRNVVQQKRYVDRTWIDEPAENLAAPEAVRVAQPPGPPVV